MILIDSMDWWITVLCSIGGAIIGGIFTLLGVKWNQKHQDQKDRKKELQKEYDERSRLELDKFKDFDHSNIKSKVDFECILLNIEKIDEKTGNLCFSYDEKALDLNNLCCVEYKFINSGKTEIDSVCIISNQPKTTSIIELESRDILVKNKTLSYEAWSRKRFIKPGESISIKVCYVKNKIMMSPISAVAAIYMQDINGHLWYQPLFCPTNEMENSVRGNYNEFRNNRDIASAIECFKNPILW